MRLEIIYLISTQKLYPNCFWNVKNKNSKSCSIIGLWADKENNDWKKSEKETEFRLNYLRQGIENIFREMNCKGMGLKITGSYSNHLRTADDILQNHRMNYKKCEMTSNKEILRADFKYNRSLKKKFMFRKKSES